MSDRVEAASPQQPDRGTQWSRIDTQLLHAGEPRPRIGGAAVVPIFQSSVYEHSGGGDYADIPYPRLSNLPNHKALAGKLAALEGAEAAIATASGMAAISAAMLSSVGRGGHVLVQECLYGGTYAFLRDDLATFGMEYDILDDDPDAWAGQLKPNTRAVYTEALSNPLLQIVDHRRVVEFAREHGLVSMIDATFATPVNLRPIALGYDLSLHSATKYLNGHSDLVAGAIAGGASHVRRASHLLAHLGGTLDPHACFLLHRGLKTLGVRVRQQNENALRLAELLAGRDEVVAVNYPGLPSHPQHELARELFLGFGGMLSFEVKGGQPAAMAMIAAMEIPIHGPSLGGVETSISIPARLSHSGLTPDERARMGVSDGLMRLSVGIEAIEDLIEDFSRGLETV